MSKGKLNESESVHGFVAWITTRDVTLIVGAEHDAAPLAELVKRFCETNDLPEVTKDWPDNLIHPLPLIEKARP